MLLFVPSAAEFAGRGVLSGYTVPYALPLIPSKVDSPLRCSSALFCRKILSLGLARRVGCFSQLLNHAGETRGSVWLCAVTLAR